VKRRRGWREERGRRLIAAATERGLDGGR